MATWMVHLRIADALLKHIEFLEPEMFTIGNIAPDCGTGIKDSMGEFDPPPKITHWTPTGRKSDICPQDFFEAYLKVKTADRSALSFYMGYYSHLWTDAYWSKQIFYTAYDLYGREKPWEEFILAAKKDWNYLDHAFYFTHPGLRTYALLDGVRSVPDYLPYYQPGQLTRQSRFIADYYKSLTPEKERTVQYLTPEKTKAFVLNVQTKLLPVLRNILEEGKK